MKSGTLKLAFLPAQMFIFCQMLVSDVAAQTFNHLYDFTPPSNFHTNSDGANPRARLILSGDFLYGTAYGGGSSGSGTVFKINTNGTGFTTLHSFTAVSYSQPLSPYTNSEGADPLASLTLSEGTLYGTTYYGGTSGYGAVFKLNPDGTGFTNLHSFTALSGSYATNSDGANPIGGLILSDSTLYGTAANGGSWGNGTVFKLNTDGTGFTTLHHFTASFPYYTNSDGATPFAGLILSEDTLYGTAANGGRFGSGSVFAISTNGSGYTNLHSFSAMVGYTNNEGGNPEAGLILSGDTLYGTTYSGGSSSFGTLFSMKTDGTCFTNLHNFSGGSGGSHPSAGLILSSNTLCGTASEGNGSAYGTVFAVNSDGTGFENLHRFSGGSDGATPLAGLILSGNTLYGTFDSGGNWGYGGLFSLSFAPQLTIIPSGRNVVLTWPTTGAGFDYTGFKLYATTNLVAPVYWTTVIPNPVTVSGVNAVTNPTSDGLKFYRLSQ